MIIDKCKELGLKLTSDTPSILSARKRRQNYKIMETRPSQTKSDVQAWFGCNYNTLRYYEKRGTSIPFWITNQLETLTPIIKNQSTFLRECRRVIEGYYGETPLISTFLFLDDLPIYPTLRDSTLHCLARSLQPSDPLPAPDTLPVFLASVRASYSH